MAIGAGFAIGILAWALFQCLRTHEIRMTAARTIKRGELPKLYWGLISFQCFAVAFLIMFAFFPWQH
jgi:hypothetical protein